MTHKYSRRTVTALLGTVPLFGAGVPAHAQPSDTTGGAQAPGQAVRDLAIEGYIFGYPMVTMEMTRRVTTNAAKVEGLRGPMGQFASAREYPSAAFKDVTAPNARHALQLRMARSFQGAIYPARAGRARPVLPDADAERLD